MSLTSRFASIVTTTAWWRIATWSSSTRSLHPLGQPSVPHKRTRSAVFLDRDGVINRRRPDHVKSWSEFEFLPTALEALRLLRDQGATTVVITNQSAIGHGLL